MSSGAAKLPAAENFKRPSFSTVATWVKTAWISLKTVCFKNKRFSFQKKKFQKCSISHNLDGTEDDTLWTDVRDDIHDTDDEDDIYDDLLVEE